MVDEVKKDYFVCEAIQESFIDPDKNEESICEIKDGMYWQEGK